MSEIAQALTIISDSKLKEEEKIKCRTCLDAFPHKAPFIIDAFKRKCEDDYLISMIQQPQVQKERIQDWFPPPLQSFKVKSEIPLTPLEWQKIKHPQYSLYLKMFFENHRIAAQGRRRIGKTHMFKQIAHEAQQAGKCVVYVQCNSDIKLFSITFNNAVDQLIEPPVDQHPSSVWGIIHKIIWLLECGVSIILDEFQELLNTPGLASELRNVLDTHTNSSLFVTGSNITAMTTAFISTQPLYQRFTRCWVEPMDCQTIYQIIKSTYSDLTTEEFLTIYSAFDGIIGHYTEIIKNNLFSPENRKNIKKEIKNYLGSVFFGDTYLFELGASGSELFVHIFSKSTLNNQPNSQLYLDIFKHCGYITQEKSFIGTNTRLRVTDFPYLFYKSNSLDTLEGDVIERISRVVLPSYLSKKFGAQASVIEGYWEFDAEIDVVAEDTENRIMYWGSCKRNDAKQSLKNLLAHIYSYLRVLSTTKDLQKKTVTIELHKWISYNHILMFISPNVIENENLHESAIHLTKTDKGKEILETVRRLFPNSPEYKDSNYQFPFAINISSVCQISLSELLTNNKQDINI